MTISFKKDQKKLPDILLRSSRTPGGEHSTLEVTGVLGQQLKTRGLLRDFFSEKGGHSVRRQKKRGSNGENKTNSDTFSSQNTYF